MLSAFILIAKLALAPLVVRVMRLIWELHSC